MKYNNNFETKIGKKKFKEVATNVEEVKLEVDLPNDRVTMKIIINTYYVVP